MRRNRRTLVYLFYQFYTVKIIKWKSGKKITNNLKMLLLLFSPVSINILDPRSVQGQYVLPSKQTSGRFWTSMLKVIYGLAEWWAHSPLCHLFPTLVCKQEAWSLGRRPHLNRYPSMEKVYMCLDSWQQVRPLLSSLNTYSIVFNVDDVIIET